VARRTQGCRDHGGLRACRMQVQGNPTHVGRMQGSNRGFCGRKGRGFCSRKGGGFALGKVENFAVGKLSLKRIMSAGSP